MRWNVEGIKLQNLFGDQSNGFDLSSSILGTPNLMALTIGAKGRLLHCANSNFLWEQKILFKAILMSWTISSALSER